MVFLPIHNLMLALATPLANHGVAVNHFNLGARALQPIANGIPLRIMPLGASITYGQASTDGNGYRQELRNQLVAAGNTLVNFVGSRKAGTMRDNDVEGWPGARIEEVHAKATAAVSVPKYKPNVFLVNAGTNDALQDKNVNTAAVRMEAMLVDLWRLSPRAVVVLSTLLMNRDANVERRVLDINNQFRGLVKSLRDRGRRVVLVDMHSDQGPMDIDLADQTHPNDGGYRKMANLWLAGLVTAGDEGWIQAPEHVAGLPDDGLRS
ncbi:SGNH hydrolase-type esterase domain-containing protein [Apiosordaria backusii]|uniref:SGNH hydrolase-type esterase domain-containing protein n=1 Tax=Apiosordaria backusii TaxID=314023 RepID=A0AA40E8M8_9PEZI|nr:SGNH hydrolase-type esterase domain-containing protein [Apiosordaria backusii]